MLDYDIRPGTPGDEAALMALFDEAVAWMAARGQPGQWGDRPFSARRETRQRVREFAESEGLWIAERGDDPLGAVIVGVHPPHVEPIDRSELYIELLISSRRHAGNAIGARLVRLAGEIAEERGRDVLRADCWAGAATLRRFYDPRGFQRSGPFDPRRWIGQGLE